MVNIVKREIGLLFGILLIVFMTTLGEAWLNDLSNHLTTAISFFMIFTIMLWVSFKVVQHADMLAIKLGEPYGTMILTFAVISIEVIMISAIMLNGEHNPTLGRDTMFSVIMIVLNGLVGLSLLIGGLKHVEQSYNLQGANTYMIVLIPLAAIGLILPDLTKSSSAGTFSETQTGFIIAITILLYVAFLIAQTIRHKNYFVVSLSKSLDVEHHKPKSISFHLAFLFAYMAVIILLSKKMAIIIEYTITEINAPVALGGFLVAILVLSPEGLAAIKSAARNNLQRSINICLGSALATIGLTIPAILIIGLVTDENIILGLDELDIFLLILTLVVSIVNFSSAKSNIIQGIVHLMIFLVYIILLFD